MPTPLVPNAARVTVKGVLFGQSVENVWYVTTTDPPTPTDLSTIAGIFQVAYGAIAAPLSNQISFTEIVVRYLGDAGGPEFSLAISPPQAGGQVQQSMPSSVCICISLRTALAGRRFRGRKYISGLTELDVENNFVNTDTCNDLVTAIQDMIDALFTAGYPLSIVSFVGLTVTIVTTAICTDFFIDSQRRRLTGRGR